MCSLSDPRIIRLRQRYGMEGYGIYHALLEALSSADGYSLPLDSEAFAYEWHVDASVVQDIILSFSLFSLSEDSTTFSLLNPPAPPKQPLSRTERARRAAQARWHKSDPQPELPLEETQPTPDHCSARSFAPQPQAPPPPVTSPPCDEGHLIVTQPTLPPPKEAEESPAPAPTQPLSNSATRDLSNSASQQLDTPTLFPLSEPSPPPQKPKPKKPSANPLHTACKEAYLSLYSKYRHGEEYYWQPKDARALNSLLKQIAFKMPEEQKADPAVIQSNFQVFIEQIFLHGDNFVRDNISIPLITSKFNEIYAQLKYGASTRGSTSETDPNRDYSDLYASIISAYPNGRPI